MSRIYDALKRLEAERSGRRHAGSGNGTNGHGANGNGASNGHGAGHGNGHGNGGNGGNGKRGWRRIFGNGKTTAHSRVALNVELGLEIEEAYQRLGTNLLASPAPDAGAMPRLLGLTSSRHGEGTTTTAAVFASILVRRRGGRVVVVEANFRTPSFSEVFGIERNGGFAELIQGQKTVAEVAQACEVQNLFAVGCGHSTLAPSALFDSPGVARALEQLRAHFDYVLFDLPPSNVYADTSILGPRLDALLIVIEADRVRIPEVDRTRRSLERLGVKLAGSVLNRRRNYIPAFIEEML